MSVQGWMWPTSSKPEKYFGAQWKLYILKTRKKIRLHKDPKKGTLRDKQSIDHYIQGMIVIKEPKE